MTTVNKLVELTLEELQLMIQNLDSKNVISDPLERFIIYSVIISQKASRTINIKFIQAQSQQSFYRCNQAIKKLNEGGWVAGRINQQDKRNTDLLPTKKCSELVKAYEGARANSLIEKGIKLPKPKTNLSIKDMLDANESQLSRIKDDVLKS